MAHAYILNLEKTLFDRDHVKAAGAEELVKMILDDPQGNLLLYSASTDLEQVNQLLAQITKNRAVREDHQQRSHDGIFLLDSERYGPMDQPGSFAALKRTLDRGEIFGVRYDPHLRSGKLLNPRIFVDVRLENVLGADIELNSRKESKRTECFWYNPTYNGPNIAEIAVFAGITLATSLSQVTEYIRPIVEESDRFFGTGL